MSYNSVVTGAQHRHLEQRDRIPSNSFILNKMREENSSAGLDDTIGTVVALERLSFSKTVFIEAAI
jgi:hypothetical protein